MSDIVAKIDRGIKYLFYALFFLTPLVLWYKTFELFEFNKLWTVFALSLLILFLWISKMIITRRIIFKRTPFDIPIALFLSSQIISTVFSMDPHVSFWGYYSRFNGGLLSITSYIFLYYAFVSNFLENRHTSPNTGGDNETDNKPSYKILFVSLLSGLAVAIWGFTSHFGYDLTCLMFRGSFDVSCWTNAFQPTVRMFSTMGQPNWLAAYFSILIPISLTIGIYKFVSEKSKLYATLYILLATLLFVETLWTGSQSGYAGLLSGLVLFIGGIAYFLVHESPPTLRSWHLLPSLIRESNSAKGDKKSSASFKPMFKPVVVIIFVLFFISFFLGNPLQEKFPLTSFSGVKSLLIHAPVSSQVKKSVAPAVGELGGSDSGKIRLVVWRGAFELFKRHPLFGTGVETFAYSYYQVKPLEHNVLSEWDYLYNKAHNEYLNYLATTGIFGLGTYLLMIGWFLTYSFQYLRRSNIPALPAGRQDLRSLLILALLAAYISILVSNFFGFSVVVINVYFFFIPALVLGITQDFGKNLPAGSLRQAREANRQEQKKEKNIENASSISPIKMCAVIVVGIVCLSGELTLLNFWFADQSYSTGYSLNRAQQYVMANQYLENAVKLYPGEDLYKNELSLNLATLGLLLYQQKQATQAANFVDRAVMLSDAVVSKHPKNVVFYKTRIQTMFELSQMNQGYFDQALSAIKTARALAPTDAKIAYNQGLLYGQKGDLAQAQKNLEEAIFLKPNYRDPRYALASYLIQDAKTETDPTIKQKLLDQAKTELHYILQNITSSDPQTKELLKSLD